MISSLFTADFFRANRQKLRSLFTGKAPIVITANGLLQRNADTPFAFRQDSNFWYLTGIEEPGVILVMDKDKEYLIAPHQESHQVTFDGALDIESFKEHSGISEVLDEKSGWKRLGGRLGRAQYVATLSAPASYIDFYGFYTNPARRKLMKKIKSFNPDIKTLDLKQHLTVMRMIKQPTELEAIQQAIDITTKTLKEVKRGIGRYGHEFEVEAAVTYGFRKRGATGHAFTPIIAGGQNACVIHYIANNASLGKSRFVLIDVGAEVSLYAADISRTYWLEEPTKRDAVIYQAVIEVQDYAYSLLKPGVLIREYEKQIEQFMGEKLRALGLIKTIDHEEVRRYFPHATSHHLGLEAHDVADYDRPIDTDMVLTVEPGIYIPEEGIGIRMEDDVLITKQGVKVLTSKLPSVLQ